MKTLLYIFALVLTVSCGSREDEPTPTPPAYTQADVQGTWKVTRFKNGNQAWQDQLGNSTITMNADGTFTTYNFPGFFPPYSGFYSFNPAGSADLFNTTIPEYKVTMGFNTKTSASFSVKEVSSGTVVRYIDVVKK